MTNEELLLTIIEILEEYGPVKWKSLSVSELVYSLGKITGSLYNIGQSELRPTQMALIERLVNALHPNFLLALDELKKAP